MSAASGAGPSNMIAGTAMISNQASNQATELGAAARGPKAWANVRPLDRSAAGAVGEWVDLLARISHDLRTPLNAVIGFSDVMQQELFGPLGNARYHEYVRHIRTSGVELLQAAEDALAMTALLAEPKAAIVEDVALLAVVTDVVDDLSGRIGFGEAAIVIDVPDELEVRSDRQLLTRALRQLVIIGLSRAEPGARIGISAEVQHGLVDLRVEVSHSSGANSIATVSEGPGFNRGLGRRDLGVWLATSILDLIDCRLAVETEGGRLGLHTTLEQAIQRNFFTTGEPALA